MCVVSMVMQHTTDEWFRRLPVNPPTPVPWWPTVEVTPLVTPAEVQEFRRLLDRAREYDRQHNEPDCELEEKKTRLKNLADELGVKIDFI